MSSDKSKAGKKQDADKASAKSEPSSNFTDELKSIFRSKSCVMFGKGQLALFVASFKSR